MRKIEQMTVHGPRSRPRKRWRGGRKRRRRRRADGGMFEEVGATAVAGTVLTRVGQTLTLHRKRGGRADGPRDVGEEWLGF